MARRKSQNTRSVPAAKAAPAQGTPGQSFGVQARYDAAGSGRRLAGWNAPGTGPNKALNGLATIRNRSRDAGRNEWSGASSARVMVTNLIGTGIVARPKTKSKAMKARLVDEWDRFVRTCDADGVLDFYGQQVLGTMSWFQSGEFFARFRPRRITDGLPVPMQVQLLESDMCPLFDTDAWPGMAAGAKIRQGIEFDKVGRRAAFWMYREHPGDLLSGAVSMDQLVRVPADQVIHVFRPVRIGQIRGVPESAPILTKLRSIMNFDDAVLTRQQLANLFTLFITRPTPTNGEAGIDPLTGKAIEYGLDGGPMAALEPGISQELLPGEDVKFSDPPDAGAGYADFMRGQNLGVASGQGVPYELMTGDIRDVSDRTLRVVINEFRRYCEQLQWTIIIPQFCERVRAAWAQAGLISGALSEKEFTEALRTEWAPQGWAYVHPVQDVQAKALEVAEGFRSRSSVIAERGYDPETVDQERADDQQRAIDLGLAFEPVDPNQPQEPTDAEEAEAEKVKAEARLLDAKAARERDEGQAALRRANAEADRLKAEAGLAEARSNQASAEAAAAEANAEALRAKAASEAALLDLRKAIEDKESAERIAALAAQREAADGQADAMRRAHEAAETHAEEMRQLAKAAERNKVEVSRLEVEAAQVGLAELRGA